MTDLKSLLQNNIRWADGVKARDPDFFSRLAAQQTPEFLWIGCSDSRVPATQIVDMDPGSMFVHRNIANTVVHTDLNCLSVMQFAVEALKVKHIIVCGHYGCGGVKAAMGDQQVGMIDNWLRNIRDVYYQNRECFEGDLSDDEKFKLLCELNVKQQVSNVSRTTIVQNAWARGQQLTVHGWIYDIHDGLLHELTEDISSADQVPEQYRLQGL